ncbi:hypothetical protein BH10PSE17_BH10PSE17_08420 [soil metagenome]
MPTYAYRCQSCGHAADEWLKMSEATAERVCPNCGKATYAKQVTAAAFQLKGGGWYVTDFREGQAKKPDAKPGEAAKSDSGDAGSGKEASPAPAAADAAKPADKPADKPAASPAPAPAAPKPTT